MSHVELDDLCQKLFTVAEAGLESGGTFPPVCAVLEEKGQTQIYAADVEQVPDFRDQLEALKLRMKEISSSLPIRAVAFCADTILHRPGKAEQEGIRCCLEHSDGTSAARFKPYSRREAGGVEFGEPFSFPHEREILGLTGITLTPENETAMAAPTPQQICLAVDKVTPRGGPGFLVMEGPSDDYCQTAGGDGRFTAEWRQYSGTDFKHWVAGMPPRISERTVKIETNGAEVTVRENEVLSADHVKQILIAFAKGEDRPGFYVWRDASAKFRRGD